MALERTPPTELRDALARTLGDPTLEIAFWIPERQEYVDPLGFPVALPLPGSRQAVTRLEHMGEPFAAFVHDPTLSEEPRLVQAAGAAAHMALENVRLQAEVRAQLVEVEESRARIVAAGGEERRRIERDLHDGAQQRLVALALELRSAQRKLGTSSDPAWSGCSNLLSPSCRSRSRNYASCLTASTRRSSLRRVSPARSTLWQRGRRCRSPCGRLSTAGYLRSRGHGVLRGLRGAHEPVKHGRASRATVSASLPDNVLLVEVTDDGIGGAEPQNGSGLRGLADRVEAQGGRLTVESPPGGGTRVVGKIPCAS